MLMRSFVAVLLISAVLLVDIPVFGAQLECASDYGIILNSLVLKKDGAVVSGIEITGGEYTVSGSIQVSSVAAVQSLDVTFDVWVKGTVKISLLPPFETSFPVGCNPCAENGITCSYLETTYGISNICSSNSEILSGIYTFEFADSRPDDSAKLPQGTTPESATITIQFFSSGAQVGCMRKTIPIIVP